MFICKILLLLSFFHANVLSALGGFMKEISGYNLSKKDFIQLSKWAENIYNTAVVIDYFIANQPEIEACYNLAPVIRCLRNEADILNAFFIDHEKDVEI